MHPSHTVYLCDYYGRRLALLDGWDSLQYSRATNGTGKLRIDVPASVGWSDINIGQWIEVWREPRRGYASKLEGLYSINKLPRAQNRSRGRFTSIQGVIATATLDFHIVTANKAQSWSLKSNMPADNIMKVFVRENFGVDADTARTGLGFFPNTAGGRSWTSLLGFTVQPDYSLAPVQTVEGAGIRILEVLNSIVKSAAEDEANPCRLFFDLVPTGLNEQFGLQFRTYKDLRGIDRGLSSATPLILPSYTCFGDIEMDRDHEREVNQVYAATNGDNAARTIYAYTDQARRYLHPYNLREEFIDAGPYPDDTVARQKSYKKLREGKPTVRFRADFLPNPAYAYNIDFFYGDKMGVELWGDLYEVVYEGFDNTVTAKGEELKMRLEVYTSLLG